MLCVLRHPRARRPEHAIRRKESRTTFLASQEADKPIDARASDAAPQRTTNLGFGLPKLLRTRLRHLDPRLRKGASARCYSVNPLVGVLWVAEGPAPSF